MPGLIIEKIDRNFLARTIAQLPKGVVLITGTNGKTTTTKIVTHLLESAGLKVFTNRTGSNFTRGVIAALLGEVDHYGRLKQDIAVLELDEAYAAHFVKQVAPDYTLALNVMRDQLDRFGEIDHTAKLLAQVVGATTKEVVLNRDDPRVVALANNAPQGAKVSYFGISPDLQKLFISDDDLYGPDKPKTQKQVASVELTSFKDSEATYNIGSKQYKAKLQLSGIYNFLNVAGALALVKTILGRKADDAQLIAALAEVKPAFGRGETLLINGQSLELVLVKNPGGFRLALASAANKPAATMIAINDNYADGRDMSWLWDVDFTSLTDVKMVSGVRTYDMALRLQYDKVPVGATMSQLDKALDNFLAEYANQPKRIFCTYTAMLALRRLLKKHTTVERI